MFTAVEAPQVPAPGVTAVTVVAAAAISVPLIAAVDSTSADAALVAPMKTNMFIFLLF